MPTRIRPTLALNCVPHDRLMRQNPREKKSMPFTKKQKLDAYRLMWLIRRFEEKCAELYAAGDIGGFLHLYIGQEAIAAAAKYALRDDDNIVTAYRDHGVA